MQSSLYISNLDEFVSQAELISHFSKYGQLTYCRLGQFNNGKCKGYAKIAYSSQNSTTKVLSKKHLINNKMARIEIFIEDQELAKVNDNYITERRICVLKIPKNMDDPSLLSAFLKFGDIENAYIRNNKNKKTNHGFVTFREKESALNALASELIKIRIGNDTKTLIIREFQAKRAKKQHQNNNRLKQHKKNPSKCRNKGKKKCYERNNIQEPYETLKRIHLTHPNYQVTRPSTTKWRNNPSSAHRTSFKSRTQFNENLELSNRNISIKFQNKDYLKENNNNNHDKTFLTFEKQKKSFGGKFSSQLKEERRINIAFEDDYYSMFRIVARRVDANHQESNILMRNNPSRSLIK